MTKVTYRTDINETNIAKVSTDELASFYYPTKADVSDSAGFYAQAKKMDVSNWKEENARKNWEADKARYNLILNELRARGVKKVSRNGSWS